MAWSQGVQVKGLQKRQLRQAVHDERCRPVLEKVARMQKKSYTIAVHVLTRARVPSPRGGPWRPGAVRLIAKRLGLDVSCGSRFGELPRCMGCHRHTGWRSEAGMCRRCNGGRKKERQAGYQEWNRTEEIQQTKMKLQYYKDKLEALRSGRRHYSRQHPEPTHKFGKPIKYRLARGKPKQEAR